MSDRTKAKLLPNSENAERGILGAIFKLPDDVMGRCAEHGLTAEWFHSPAKGTIYGACEQLYTARKPVNTFTVHQHLEDRGLISSIGGEWAIEDLANYPTAANAMAEIDTMRAKWQLREIIRISAEATAAAYEEQDRATEILEDFERDALSIRARVDLREMVSPRVAVQEAINSIQDLYESRGRIKGLSTGLDALDHMTNGLLPANMYVLAARPSMGKTALGMNIAAHIGLAGHPVGVFSLEMSREQIWQRMLCAQSSINAERLRSGFLCERDFPALTKAASMFSETGIWVDDTSGITVQALRGKARRMKQKYGIKAIFMDYLQLATSNTKRGKDNRTQEVSEISSGMKALAKELEIPVVVMAQLNRNPEGRGAVKGGAASKGRPRLGDLRESGSIEQDADFVGLLWREEYYADSDEEKARLAGRAVLNIAKQRNGPVGDVKLTFLKEFCRFEVRADCAEDEE